MVAPCVERLELSIQTAGTDIERAMLSAELGCYLARIGSSESAEKIRLTLRQEFGDGRDGRVTIMLMLLEGLIVFFRDLGEESLDRVRRALFLSHAMGFIDLKALTAAWLSHIQFNRNSLKHAAESVHVAIESVSANESAALCRASLVLGDMFGFAARMDAARRWYGLARNLAVEYGDQASIGALTYNRAALHVHALRLVELEGLIEGRDLDFADAEVRSAINYQRLSGTTSLDHLLESARTGLLMLKGQFTEARYEIEVLLNSGAIPENYYFAATLHADLILCFAKAGNLNGAAAAIEKLANFDQNHIPLDDKLLILHALHRCEIDVHRIGWELVDRQALLQLHKESAARLFASIADLDNIPDRLKAH